MGKKILIIEDEQRIARTFQKKLERFGGYEVEIALGGEEGLKLMEANEYDLVLLDLVMPKFDGIAVLEEVSKDKDRFHNVPIVVLTNLNTEAEQKRAQELDVAGFFGKVDMSTEELINSIKELAKT